MHNPEHSATAGDAVRYIVRVKTRDTLDEWIHHYADGLTVKHLSDGGSVLEGGCRDRSALFGMILLLRDQNIDLISLYAVQADQRSEELEVEK